MGQHFRAGVSTGAQFQPWRKLLLPLCSSRRATWRSEGGCGIALRRLSAALQTSVFMLQDLHLTSLRSA